MLVDEATARVRSEPFNGLFDHGRRNVEPLHGHEIGLTLY